MNGNSRVSESSNKRETLWAMGLALVSLGSFMASMPQDLVWGDAPELAASAWSLGVPHPTGYPLYMICLHIAQWLPAGTVAFRSHLFSAICSSVAAAIWFLVLVRLKPGALSNHNIPAFVAAASMLCTPIVWNISTSTEVYSLFLLLSVLTIFCLQRFWLHPERGLAALMLVCGLQIVHHRLAVFLLCFVGIAVLYRIITAADRTIIWKQVPLSIAAFLGPLLFLLYFPIRAASDPVINWFDPDSWDGFIRLIGGEMYQSILQSGLQNLWVGIFQGTLLVYFVLPLLCYGLLAPLVLWGGYRLLLTSKRVFAICFVLYCIYQMFLMVYQVGDWQVFLLPSIVIASVPLYWGLCELQKMISTRCSPAMQRFAPILFLLVILFPASVPCDMEDLWASKWFPASNRELAERFATVHDPSTHVYASQVWNPLEGKVVVITGLYYQTADNEFFPLLYQSIVERGGENVPLVGANFTRYDWYREQINRRYGLDMPTTQDRLYETREDWMNDIRAELIEPLMKQGIVFTPSPMLPQKWYSDWRIRNLEIVFDRSQIPTSYQNYIPHPFLQRIDLRPAPTPSDGETP